jgi:hypothetical protein
VEDLKHLGIYMGIVGEVSDTAGGEVVRGIREREYAVSHISIVYGCIEGATYYADSSRYYRMNAELIAALPETDEWPYLTRDLFAVPRDEHMFATQVVTFGASYNLVEWVWDVWLAKFEGLLRQMYWDAVHVHLRTELVGNHHYQWVPTGVGDLPGPVTVWEFTGGPRDFKDHQR